MPTTCLRIVLGGGGGGGRCCPEGEGGRCCDLVWGREVLSRGEREVLSRGVGRCCDLVWGREVLSRGERCCDLVWGEGGVVTWSWGGGRCCPEGGGRCCPEGGKYCDLVPGGRKGGVVQRGEVLWPGLGGGRCCPGGREGGVVQRVEVLWPLVLPTPPPGVEVTHACENITFARFATQTVIISFLRGVPCLMVIYEKPFCILLRSGYTILKWGLHVKGEGRRLYGVWQTPPPPDPV